MHLIKKLFSPKIVIFSLLLFITLFLTNVNVLAQAEPGEICKCNEITQGQCYLNNDINKPCIQTFNLPFGIPSLSHILTFAIRAFFIIAGLAALLFLLLGALAWVTSGGDKENVSKAQSKITNAIVGVILIAVVLAIIVTLEQVVFNRRVCLGLSCPITIPSILE